MTCRSRVKASDYASQGYSPSFPSLDPPIGVIDNMAMAFQRYGASQRMTHPQPRFKHLLWTLQLFRHPPSPDLASRGACRRYRLTVLRRPLFDQHPSEPSGFSKTWETMNRVLLIVVPIPGSNVEANLI